MSSKQITNTDIQFLIKIGMALQKLGMDACRLESALENLSKKLNIEADFFSTSTALMVAINSNEQQTHYFKRTEPGDIHLERLSRINSIGNKVFEGKLSTSEGLKKIEELDSLKERYSKPVVNICFGLVAICVCLFMGSNLKTALFSFIVGSVVGILILNKKTFRIGQISDAVAAFVATLLSYTLAHYFSDLMPNIMLLASILIIIPGLTLTISVTELATQNLVAGTSRLMHALMSFFKISFGVALALKVFYLAGGKFQLTVFSGYDFWVPYAGLIAASWVLTILFLATPKDVFWISCSCFIGFLTADFGSHLLGPHLGVMLGGLSVAAGSHVFTNFLKRPILITLMPGILVLVPGSIGFQSLNSMYENNLLEGLDAAFQTFSMVISLVSGIFVGNLIIKTKQNF